MKIETKLEKATEIAERYYNLILPVVTKISIAGSIRRQCEAVGDIDFVVVRDPDNFQAFKDIVDGLPRIKGDAHGRVCQRETPEGIMLDINMCELDEFGWKMIQVTGDGNWYLSIKKHLEAMGHTEKLFATEEEIFSLCGIDYVDPIDRTTI